MIQNLSELKKTAVTKSNTATRLSNSDSVKFRLETEYLVFGSYRKVARKYGKNVSGTMVWRIINEDYEPKTVKIRQALGYRDPAQVFSVNGNIPAGSISIGALVCECGQPFISNHPRRRRCFICSPYRGVKR